MRIRLILTVFCILTLFHTASAQSARWQVQRLSIGTGSALYRGDLDDRIVMKNIKPQVSLSYSKYVMPGIGFTFNFSHATVAAADSLSTNETIKSRNLSFRSPINEASVIGFWEILPDMHHNSWRKTLHLTPYVFAGVGAFTYNPYAQVEGTKTFLQPLGTEGQFVDENKKPYKKLALCVPFGAGMSFRFLQRVGAFGELGFRRTMTDYLDDASTSVPATTNGLSLEAIYFSDPDGEFTPGSLRGDASTRDWYIMLNIGLSYFIGR